MTRRLVLGDHGNRPLGANKATSFAPLLAPMPPTPSTGKLLGVRSGVEVQLSLPACRQFYDQKTEGACVGFAFSWAMSILNFGQKYDARWLWRNCKVIDGDPLTDPSNPEDGTTPWAAANWLRVNGHVRWSGSFYEPPRLSDGIVSHTGIGITVDDIRVQISAQRTPVPVGISWFRNFDTPNVILVSPQNAEFWVGVNTDTFHTTITSVKDVTALGGTRGTGHCICLYGASDARQAFRFVNSWGVTYPTCWFPYAIMDQLMANVGAGWAQPVIMVDR